MRSEGYNEEQGFVTQKKVHYLGLCTLQKSTLGCFVNRLIFNIKTWLL